MVLWILAAACVIRLWMMPLGSSLWVDEMGTEFVVTHGAHDPTLAVAPQVPASVYYALPRLSTAVLGGSEVAYRLPSLLALGLALILIGRLAARLIHPGAAWFAIFACLALKGFDYEAADARPYALGTLVACAALRFLVRWLDDARWADAVGFVAAAALLWRVHLLYWPFYAVFAVYAVARRGTGARVAAVFGGVGLLLIPVALQAIALRAQAHAHVMAAPPGWRALLDSLKPGLVAAPAAVALFVRRKRLPSSSLALILAWWLATPLALFAFSRSTGASVFLERYLSLALPGAAMAATAAVAVFLPERCWRAAAIVLGLGVLAVLGRWNVLWPPHHPSDWRDAAAAVNRAGLPVLSPSPFLEARAPAWRPGYPVNSFLYSDLLAYPIREAVTTLPFDPEPIALPDAAFVLYGGGRNAERWRDRLARPGWQVHSLGSFGDVLALVFVPPGATMNFGR